MKEKGEGTSVREERQRGGRGRETEREIEGKEVPCIRRREPRC